MKLNIFLVIFICILSIGFQSCKTVDNKNPDSKEKDNTMKTEENSNQNDNTITFTGSFRSLKGVMHELSCFGYNIGILSTSNGKEIPICFDKLGEELEICTENLSVTGTYEKIYQSSGAENPCPGGEREILMVSEYECK